MSSDVFWKSPPWRHLNTVPQVNCSTRLVHWQQNSCHHRLSVCAEQTATDSWSISSTDTVLRRHARQHHTQRTHALHWTVTLKFKNFSTTFLGQLTQHILKDTRVVYMQPSLHKSQVWFEVSNQGKFAFSALNRDTAICKGHTREDSLSIYFSQTSVLWRCWLGGRKGIRPVKNWVVRCWRCYLSGARCRLAYGPADATATHCLLLQ